MDQPRSADTGIRYRRPTVAVALQFFSRLFARLKQTFAPRSVEPPYGEDVAFSDAFEREMIARELHTEQW